MTGKEKGIYHFESGEVLNINKPEGVTSFLVVKKIRSRFKIKKVGHAGTLDPFATGVLLILTGKATKRSQEMSALEKQYVAEVEFGMETDTLDRDGEIVNRCSNMTEPQRATLINIFRSFEGEIEQIPPIYSAIKYKGRRLYKYARKGVAVELKPRRVRIGKISLLKFNWPFITIDVTCSKGTYIRSLARDLGKELRTGAYLKSLVRIRIGEYSIDDAMELEEFLQISNDRWCG